MLGLVGHAQACPVFSKINCKYLWESLSYFVYLLHVVKHPGKLQCYHVVLVRYGLACAKFSEITNHYYLWKGLSDFVDLLHVVICILLDIRWSYQNLLFWAGIVWYRLSANQTVRCFILKNYMRYQVDFLVPLKLQKVCYFGLFHKVLLANQFAGFLTFDLFDLLILILRLHYYIVLVFFSIQSKGRF